jgi:hypothetical protein
MISLRAVSLVVVPLLGCGAPGLHGRAGANACLPATTTSASLRADLAAKASDPTAVGDTTRALYHLPVASPEKVEQVLTESLCTKAIVVIRLWRGDNQAPESVYLFRVGSVYVATGPSGTAFSGAVWTFDQSLTRVLSGVLQ